MPRPIEERLRIMGEALDNRDREIAMWRKYGGELETKVREQEVEIAQLRAEIENSDGTPA